MPNQEMKFSVRALFCAASVIAAGCSGPQTRHSTAQHADVPVQGSIAPSVGEAGENLSAHKASVDIQLPPFVIVQRNDDVFRENDTDFPVTVEYGWDYRAGVAVERVYDRGTTTLRSERQLPGQMLSFTDAENELAFALTRETPELAVALSEQNLNFYAGFAYFKISDPGCSTGSRCMHVIVSGGFDGQRPVAHAIVDLSKRRVVHPLYNSIAPDAPQQH